MIELRSRAKLAAHFGADAVHALGFARTLQDGRSVKGKLIITMVAGQPELRFRATLAHEVGHIFLYERGVFGAPPMISEGFSEFVSYQYLRKVDTSNSAVKLAELMLCNSDPVYGGGLRAMMIAFKTYGRRQVLQALTHRNFGAVGLAEA